MPTLQNAKHEAVLQAYFADPQRIGYRAWRKVFPKSSKHAAETSFTRLLNRAECAARLAELDGKVAAGLVADKIMSAAEVLERLTNLGRGNLQAVGHLLLSEQVVDDLKKLAPEVAEAIGELTVESYEEHDPDGDDGETRTVKRVRLKLQHKGQAVRDLGLHYKLFTEKIEVDDKRSIAERLDAARRRFSNKAPRERVGGRRERGAEQKRRRR